MSGVIQRLIRIINHILPRTAILIPFFIQAVEFARNFCGLADSVLEDAVLSAECAYMVDVYGVDFLEFIYAEGRLPDEVCSFLGACP